MIVDEVLWWTGCECVFVCVDVSRITCAVHNTEVKAEVEGFSAKGRVQRKWCGLVLQGFQQSILYIERKTK